MNVTYFCRIFLLLLLCGCSSNTTSRTPSSQVIHSSTAGGSLLHAPLEAITTAMPTMKDFPEEWKFTSQTSPPAFLPGLNALTTQISAVEPPGCLDFIAGFVSEPGSSIRGEILFSAEAFYPDSPTPDQRIFILALRNSPQWLHPSHIRDYLHNCEEVRTELSFGSAPVQANFSSRPLDTDHLAADAAGLTTTLTTDSLTLSFSTLSAYSRDIHLVALTQSKEDSRDQTHDLMLPIVEKTLTAVNSL